MKRLLHLSGALALGALLLSGCAAIARKPAPPRPRAFALAVTVYGSLQPTPAQWASIQAAAARELTALGYVLVSDLSLADRIIRVDFTPNPANPEHSGRAVVIGFMPNPYRTLGNISYVPTSEKRTWNSSYYYDQYDPMRTYSWYSDGYTYNGSSGMLVPVTRPAAPPRRDEPPNRDVRPPDAGRTRPERVAGRIREDYPASNRGTYPRYDPPSTSSYPGSDSGSSYGGSGSSSSSSYGGSASSGSSSYSSSGSGSYSRDVSDSRSHTVEP